MKAAIYARSFIKNKHNVDQVAACKEFVNIKGGTVVCVFVDKGAASDKKIRPNLKKMIDMSYNGHFDTIVVYEPARLFRNLINLEDLRLTLDKIGVKLLVTMK